MATETTPALELDGDAQRVDELSREILREGYRSFSVVRLELVENDGVTLKMVLARSP